MYPGLSDADVQVATFAQQQRLSACLRQHVISSLLPTSVGRPSMSTAMRQQSGALLVRVGRRLEGMHALTRERLGSVAPSKRNAIA